MSDDSTDLNEMREALYQRMDTLWRDADGNPLTPFKLGKESFTPPEAPWAWLTIKHNKATQRTLGQPGLRRFERNATAYLQLFFLPTTTETDQDIITKAAQKMFEGRSIDGTTIWFKDVDPKELGEIDDGAWVGLTIEANFEYEQKL